MKDDDALRLLEAAVEADPGRILDALLDVSAAERGFLVLGDQIPFARHMDGDEVRRAHEKVSRTLLDRARHEGRPILASDADLQGIESVQEQKARSVCVLPLRASNGAVYLDHRYEKGLFGDLATLDRLAVALDGALAKRRPAYDDLVGASAPMKALFQTLDRIAQAPYPVLIFGESGTGKELVARAVHRRSVRWRKPLVAANCATLPENLIDAELFGHAKGAFTGADHDRPGLFAQADGGVLFLDEIACLSSAAQESMLRVLESGELRPVGGTKTLKVDVRVLAATNEDLELHEGFRRDLFYRLNVLRVDLPPLRDRKDDLPLLVEHGLDLVARETGHARKRLGKDALALLVEHRWPGNVRELLNVLRRGAALAASDTLGAADFAFLKERVPAAPDGLTSLDDYIRGAVEKFGGTMELQAIADRLGISRKTLWEKKKRWGL